MTNTELFKFLFAVWSIAFWVNFAVDYLIFKEPLIRTFFIDVFGGFAFIGLVVVIGVLFLYFTGEL